MFDLAIAVFIGLPFGFLAGYLWRDRISRARRVKVRDELAVEPQQVVLGETEAADRCLGL